MHSLWLPPHGLALMPEPALSALSGRGAEAMARRAQERVAPGAVLPRRLHRPRLAQCLCSGRATPVLRHPVRGSARDAAGHRRRSQAPRRTHRSVGRPAHLGTDPHPAPSRPLRHSRRRLLARWSPLAGCPAQELLSPGARSGPLLPPRFLEMLRQTLRDDTAFRSRVEHVEDLLVRATSKEWIVYAKRPFGGPQQVLGYLASYTHRIAISERPLVGFDSDLLRFLYHHYRD